MNLLKKIKSDNAAYLSPNLISFKNCHLLGFQQSLQRSLNQDKLCPAALSPHLSAISNCQVSSLKLLLISPTGLPLIARNNDRQLFLGHGSVDREAVKLNFDHEGRNQHEL